MKVVLSTVLAILGILYPFCVYWGLKRFEPRLVAMAILVVVCVRLLYLKKKISGEKFYYFAGVGITVLFIASVILSNSEKHLLVLPVLINFFFLCFFGLTLKFPPPLVERLARMHFPEMPQEAIVYCRRVTIVWCLFFVVNGGISLLIALQGQLLNWTLYNGFICYILMGFLFLSEFCYRKFVKEPQFKEAMKNR